jgi:hypothetical protein
MMRIKTPKLKKAESGGFFGKGTNSPIVNHNNFTDAPRPTLSSPQATFNPGNASQAGVMPNGPSKYPPGQPRGQRNVAKNLGNSNPPNM